MWEIFDIISKPIGMFLGFIYGMVSSYGLAILIFTVCIKIIMLPFTIKQQKTLTKSSQFQPKMKELEKKYKNNQQKYQEELMKLYKEEDMNPLSGCLITLIQIPIIISLYQVVRRPLTYMYGISIETLERISSVLNLDIVLEKITEQELAIAQAMNGNMDKLGFLSGVEPINFDFFGLDLSQMPVWNQPSILWLIPVLSAVSAFVMMKSNPSSKSSEPLEGMMGSMTKNMNYVMPVISFWIGFQFPLTIGLYWIANNVTTAIQQNILVRFFNKKFAEEQSLLEQEKQKKKNKGKKALAEQLEKNTVIDIDDDAEIEGAEENANEDNEE